MAGNTISIEDQPLFVKKLYHENAYLKRKMEEDRKKDETMKYSLLGEVVHLRRMMEYDLDAIKERDAKIAALTSRAEKAEKELFNINKWLEIRKINLAQEYE